MFAVISIFPSGIPASAARAVFTGEASFAKTMLLPRSEKYASSFEIPRMLFSTLAENSPESSHSPRKPSCLEICDGSKSWFLTTPFTCKFLPKSEYLTAAKSEDLKLGMSPTNGLRAARSASETSARTFPFAPEKSSEKSQSSASSREFLRVAASRILGDLSEFFISACTEKFSSPSFSACTATSSDTLPETGFRFFCISNFFAERTALIIEPSAATTCASASSCSSENSHFLSVSSAEDFFVSPAAPPLAVFGVAASVFAIFAPSAGCGVCAVSSDFFARATRAPEIFADSISALFENSAESEYFIFAESSEIFVPSGSGSFSPETPSPPSPTDSDSTDEFGNFPASTPFAMRV